MLTSWEKHVRNSNAQRQIQKALKDGVLVRPDICELCGDIPDPIKMNDIKRGIYFRHPIYAHHWNGHNNALDVWWICHTCNARLRGDEYHSGLVVKSEARQIILLTIFSTIIRA